jgi:hypothetical protein
MPVITINQQDAIDLFHQLMQPDSPFRVLRLLGEAKIGKSHLMAKVYPALACETHQARCAMLDLRNRAQTVPDILHAVYSLLGGRANFPAYHTAHTEWLRRPLVEVHGLQALLSLVSIRAEEGSDESRKWVRHLTTQLTTDLGNLNDGLVVLLFDAVDDADESTQDWLMDTLLVQLVPLPHLRMVVAGRSTLEAYGSYAAFCHSRELLPVREEEEYIAYCRQVGADLVEQSIRDFAKACDYKPGLFVDYATKFIRRETAHV